MKIKLISVIITVCIIISCKKEESIPKISNTILPNSNSLVNQEVVFGNDNSQSSIYQIIDKGNDNYYYHGLKNGSRVIGEISNTGSIVWEKNLNFTVRNIYRIQRTSGILKDAILVVGVLITDNSNKGIISLYKSDGTFLSDLSYDEYNYTFFNGVNLSKINQSNPIFDTNKKVKVGNSKFDYIIGVAVGGAGTSNNTVSPFLCYFSIDDVNGSLSKNLPSFISGTTQQRFEEYSQYRFSEIVGRGDIILGKAQIVEGVFPICSGNCPCTAPNPCSEEYCFPEIFGSAYKRNNNNETVNFSVMGINESASITHKYYNSSELGCVLGDISGSINKANIQWNKDVLPQSVLYKSFLSLGGNTIKLARENNNISPKILIVGNVEMENEKRDKPEDGGYWKGGLVAKLNSSGDIEWKREISISPYNDFFNSCFVDNNVLYVAGASSQFVDLDYSQVFGYGIIEKISISSGNTLSTNSFGNAEYQSLFNTLIVRENEIKVGGYTKRINSQSNSGFNSWFVSIQKP